MFLAKGGKTVYFGDIGENSRTLLDYFENNGARHCDDAENPAEFMLEIVNAGSSGQGPDWHEVWKNSEEAKGVQTQIDELHEQSSHRAREHEPTKEELSEFAMPFTTQISVVTKRVFQQYWRMPSYILAKWTLGTAAGLFIGFSFYQADSSTQGLQNVIFSAFMVCTIFSSLVQQVCEIFRASTHWIVLTRLPDHASLRQPALSLRSQGTPQQSLLLESLYLGQHRS